MMGKGKSILFSEMTPGPDFEAEFNSWYDTVHIPERMACPGFVSGQRYRRHEGAGYLAVYEMDDLGAMDTEAYTKVKTQPSEQSAWMLKNVTGFSRYLANETSVRARGNVDSEVDATVLYAVAFNVPAEAAEDFDGWYEQDHVPLLMEEPKWLMVRRLRVADGVPETYTHLALHYLADAEALNSPAREKAHETPWRARISREPWFKGTYMVFDRMGQRQHAKA
ncbi:MAG: hypothetical protein K0R27_3430 [Xanthobacteraceae bacterium]|jgi:hypothetical protein|nr:hypothetical protein [Xanthobacteraceae bacterium]